MSIVKPTDFVGQNLIAQIEQVTVSNNVQRFIDKYEPKFLTDLLGKVLYNEFILGLAEEPIPDKWVALRYEFGLKEMIVDYVYYFYIRDAITFTSGTGEVKASNDNSTPASSLTKQIDSWNEMVAKVRFFDLDASVYPNWNRVFWRGEWGFCCGCHHRIPDIYEFKNSLGL